MKKLFKNKKMIIIACVPIMAIMLGLSVWAVVDNSSPDIPIVNKAEIVDKTVSDDSQSESTTEPIDNTENKIVLEEKEIIAEKLSSEDIALKNEIAKVAPNAADFRHSRTETIKGKRYELTFSNMGDRNNENKNEKLTYVNSSGDSFTYNLNTGNLSFAKINSAKTVKSDDIVTESAAEKIAYDYASQGRNMDEYPLSYTGIDEDGYIFSYRRYVSGYRTDDFIQVWVGYDGAIITINDRKDEYIDKNLLIGEEEKAKVKAETDKILAKMSQGSYIKEQWIGISNSKLYMYTSFIDAQTGKIDNSIAAIPLE